MILELSEMIVFLKFSSLDPTNSLVRFIDPANVYVYVIIHIYDSVLFF